MRKGKYSELSKRFFYSEDVVEILGRLGDPEPIIKALKTPPKRYYLRVNTLKTDRSEVLSLAEEEGVDLKPDERFSDLVYVEVEGPYDLGDLPPKKVVAEKQAAESVMMGAHLYVPGVLSSPRVRKGELVTIVDKYGQAVAVGEACMSYEELMASEKGLAFRNVRSIYRCPSLRETFLYRNGFVYPQSLPAYLTSLVLDPKPGEVVVDMCAAPGGKTTHIAQIMENKGKIYAFDRSQSKVRSMAETLERLGVRIVEARTADSRYLDINYPNLKADKVLLDPPCSDLGVRPKLFEEKTRKEIVSHAEYQKQFVKVAYKILRPGGIMAYSTCTLTLEENDQVAEFAKSYGFEVLDIDLPLGKKSDYGVWFLPHEHDTPGYFIAKFRKPPKA